MTVSPLRRVYRRLARWSVLNGNSFDLVPIIVYQMAKVGSSAIIAALGGTSRAVFHVHRMHAAHLAAMREGRLERGWRLRPVTPIDLLGLRLFERVIQAGYRTQIVTVVREPIGRNFSAYFQHLDYIWHVPEAHAEVPLDQLCQGFVDRYTHDEPLTWFDDEMLPVLGVDVYQYSFPAVGHLTIKTDSCDILILQCELSEEVKSDALSAFLGTRVPPPTRKHTTAEKASGTVYGQFTEAIRLTETYVNRMLDSRYCRHFYSAAAREDLRRGYLRHVPQVES